MLKSRILIGFASLALDHRFRNYRTVWFEVLVFGFWFLVFGFGCWFLVLNNCAYWSL